MQVENAGLKDRLKCRFKVVMQACPSKLSSGTESEVGRARRSLSRERRRGTLHLKEMPGWKYSIRAMPKIRQQGRFLWKWATGYKNSLQFNEYKILKDSGKVSHEVAKQLAGKEYEKFRVIQDRNFESDFDKEINKLNPGRNKTLWPSCFRFIAQTQSASRTAWPRAFLPDGRA